MPGYFRPHKGNVCIMYACSSGIWFRKMGFELGAQWTRRQEVSAFERPRWSLLVMSRASVWGGGESQQRGTHSSHTDQCSSCVLLLLSSLNFHKCFDINHRLNDRVFILKERKEFHCWIKTSKERANTVGTRAERDFREVATSDNGKLCWGPGNLALTSLEKRQEGFLDLKMREEQVTGFHRRGVSLTCAHFCQSWNWNVPSLLDLLDKIKCGMFHPLPSTTA